MFRCLFRETKELNSMFPQPIFLVLLFFISHNNVFFKHLLGESHDQIFDFRGNDILGSYVTTSSDFISFSPTPILTEFFSKLNHKKAELSCLIVTEIAAICCFYILLC